MNTLKPVDGNTLAKADTIIENGDLIELKWLPLWMHAADNMGVIEYLVDVWIPESIKKRWMSIVPEERFWKALCLTCAGLHDIGKITPDFVWKMSRKASGRIPFILQDLLPDRVEKGSIRHDVLGDTIIHTWATTQLPLFHSIADVVGSHHGVFQKNEPYLGKFTSNSKKLRIAEHAEQFYGKAANDMEGIKRWKKCWRQFRAGVLSVSGLTQEDLKKNVPAEELMVISGLVVMSDWIASNTAYFPLISREEENIVNAYPQRIENGLKEIALPGNWNKSDLLATDDDFKELFGFMPNAMQKLVLEAAHEMDCGGLLIVEAETGSGKTEAALAAADVFACTQKAGGIIFGMPTQSTANGLLSRVSKWGRNEAGDSALSLRLAHGKASLNPQYQEMIRQAEEDGQSSGLIVNRWLSGHKRALLSDVVIGTADQLLLMGVANKHVMLRHVGSAGKISVLDEIHSYDAFTSIVVDRTLHWLGKYQVPVVLLSATLPAHRRLEMLYAYRSGYRGGSLSSISNDNWMRSEEIRKNLKLPETPGVSEYAYPMVTWTVRDQIMCKKYESDQPVKAVQTEFLDLESKVDCSAEQSGAGLETDFRLEKFSSKENALQTKSRREDCSCNELKRDSSCQKTYGNQGNALEKVLPRMVQTVAPMKETGGSCLIIANTVAGAQKIYEYFCTEMPECHPLLFHSRFTDFDRSKIETKVLDILERNRVSQPGEIRMVIGTQVLEQSLDIDADMLITELCPADLLLQRAGRLFRNFFKERPAGYESPRCLIFGASDQAIDLRMVYVPYLLTMTRNYLLEHPEIHIPKDIPSFMKEVYEKPDPELLVNDRRLDKQLRQFHEKHQAAQNQAKNILLPIPPSSAHGPGTLSDFSKVGASGTSRIPEYSVRENEDRIEVLLVRETGDGVLQLLSDPKVSLDPSGIPDWEMLNKLQLNRISLPAVFGSGLFQETTEELKQITEDRFKTWKKAVRTPILVLNENNQTVLCGKQLVYSAEIGLQLLLAE